MGPNGTKDPSGGRKQRPSDQARGGCQPKVDENGEAPRHRCQKNEVDEAAGGADCGSDYEIGVGTIKTLATIEFADRAGEESAERRGEGTHGATIVTAAAQQVGPAGGSWRRSGPKGSPCELDGSWRQ